jgi:hypothetical protein
VLAEKLLRIGSEKSKTRKIKATIIPEFKTSAEGCAPECLIFRIITNIVITVKGITSKSFIIKKRFNSLEKNKSLSRIIESDNTPIIHQLKFEFILYPCTIKKLSDLVTKCSFVL